LDAQSLSCCYTIWVFCAAVARFGFVPLLHKLAHACNTLFRNLLTLLCSGTCFGAMYAF
jgi:hypothetical protein